MQINIQYAKEEKDKTKESDFAEISPENASDDYMMCIAKNPIKAWERINAYYKDTMKISLRDPDLTSDDDEKVSPSVAFPDDALTDALEAYFFNTSAVLGINGNVNKIKALRSLYHFNKKTEVDDLPEGISEEDILKAKEWFDKRNDEKPEPSEADKKRIKTKRKRIIIQIVKDFILNVK